MAKPGRITSSHGRLAAQNTQQPQKSPLVEVFHKAKEFYHPVGTQQPRLPCPTSVPTWVPLQTPPPAPTLLLSSYREAAKRGEAWAWNNCFYLCEGEIWDFLWKFRCCKITDALLRRKTFLFWGGIEGIFFLMQFRKESWMFAPEYRGTTLK